MKKILVLSSLALVLTACSNDTGSKSKPVISKATTEQSMETTKAEEKTTATEETKKETEINISLDSKDFSSYVGEYVRVDDNNYKMKVESDGTLRNTILEPSKFQIIEESGKKYFISSTHVVRIPTKYNLVPAGTQPASGFDTKEKSDSSKHRIFTKMEGSNEVGVFEKVGPSSSSQAEISINSEDKKESASNTNSSLTEAQAEALAKGMKTFGEKMGQVPYEKTDVPGKLTWQSGGDVAGYKIYESYIYKSGGTTHRYFFVTNSSGNPEVLYSTGGTSVKNTANGDIVVMFKGIYGGSTSTESTKSESRPNENSKMYAGLYKERSGKELIINDNGTMFSPETNSTLVSRVNSNGTISYAGTNDPNSPANVASLHLIPANITMPSHYSQYKDIDDLTKDRIVLAMPGQPQNIREIYFKVGDTAEKKEEKTTSKYSKSKLDIDAIAKGDFSSIEGSREATGGGTWDITKNTIKYKGRTEKIDSISKEGNIVKIKFPRALFVVVPAGESKPHVQGWTGEGFINDDKSRDRAYIFGEGVNLVFLD